MTCGWCHREPDQHNLSSSGPTRCRYQTHRASCPANFSTKCSDHVVNGQTAPADNPESPESEIKDEKDEKDATILQLEQELAKLRLSKTPTQPPGSSAGPSPSATPSTAQATPQQSSHQATPSSVGAGIEQLAKDHIANNQQFLNSFAGHQGAYNGPLMAEIRKDPNVQMQADAILGALKQSIPVFGQPQCTPTPTNVSGINSLLNQTVPLSQTNPGLLTPAATPSTTLSSSGVASLPSSSIPSLQVPQLASVPPQDTQLLQLLLAQAQQSNFGGQPAQGAVGGGRPGFGYAGGQLGLGAAGSQLGLVTANGQLGTPFSQLGSSGNLGHPMGNQPQYQQSTPQQLHSLLQPQPWQNLPQTPQISPSILNALCQLPPDAAAAALNNLQQSLMNNVIQVQTPGLTIPVFGTQSQQQPQVYGTHQQPHGLGAQLPPHGLVQCGPSQIQPPKPPPGPANQGMSSMTGVTHVRPTEYSKHCQVEYAKKVKADSCNLVLYVWGYIAQLLLSRQGFITMMSEQEQNGRLQHLLHTLELCAMQSSSLDFNSQAWLCARNYSDRVYQDLDSGATSWSSIGPKMHPTNLMQSMSSFPKMTYKEKKIPGREDISPSQPVCAKWAACTTEDKCQYEVDTGRQCNRPHHCTYCMKTFSQARRHKENDCRKKEAAASNTAGNQPS